MTLKKKNETIKSKLKKFYQPYISVTTNDLGGLHSAIRFTLLCGRVMGLLPVAGLRNIKSHKVRFTLRSLYTPYYITSVLGQVLLFITTYMWIIQQGITLSNATNAVFYASSLVSSINLLNIGRNWPVLLRKVEEIESNLPPLSRKVAFLCNITTVVTLLAALVEHILSILHGFAIANSCDPDHVYENYFRQYMPWIFDYTPYALWKGILIEIINIQSTFIWSYNDLIIMTISIYLTGHFTTHNELLEKAVYQAHFSCEDFRTQHLKIVRLVKLINEQIGIYIVTSFGSNLYWICTQLFFSLNKTENGHLVPCKVAEVDVPNHQLVLWIDWITQILFFRLTYCNEHTIYFLYSFLFLAMKTMLVLLLAARVHSTSTEPLIILYNMPGNIFNIEVERFITQIKNIKVALSGLDFFYVTKTMILTLLGTIVTYELVLLQFNGQGN
ncbi:hypothetical protein K1T71_003491 [Dendrolimus kikuchii]|uniref:Uncharacterized protein n=1 Tax=Dendrolimus kikuchii TaxID=765133 RepID=A0ACC1DBY9_9NEOP|nr:hypothetical protein K1T71_003491 [Dendrolimus kikuchii]